MEKEEALETLDAWREVLKHVPQAYEEL